MASTAIGKLSTLAIGIALARILGPEEFGTFAVALVALLAVLSFNELGVSLAIVRWPGEPEDIVPTVATLSVLSSAVTYAGCWLAAPAFSALMGDPAATDTVRLLCVCVFVNGLVAAPAAVLQRRFRQDRKLVADQVTTWVGALTSIGCALAGMGAISLAIGQLTGSVAGAVLLAAFAPSALRLGFDPARARALLRFGLPLAGSSIVVFAAGNVDRLIVGAVLGPVPLGLYVLAVNLSNWPVAVFSQPVRAVAPATLARLQHDPASMRSTFLTTLGLLAAVTAPVCALLGGAAEPLVRLVYGAVWVPAADVLPWLAALAVLRVLFELHYDHLVVLARTGVVFTAQVLWLAALVPATVVGARAAGAPGAAAAALVVAALVVAPVYLTAVRREGIAPSAVGRRVAPPVGGALAVGVLAWLATRSLGPDLLALAVAAVPAVVAVALLLYRSRRDVRRLRADLGRPAPATSEQERVLALAETPGTSGVIRP
ncbi:oligosaccharide flippase family protein [Geodermatophilus nigrescens]|uniref:oligosaccharide flippase family protein n=1 Tax=Geodermatophilus nigrescens TaxID=1070870 RepID=UPI001C317BDD|nr:oligosaccharide flippase family protein [Geodermatophilus nigrescens]